MKTEYDRIYELASMVSSDTSSYEEEAAVSPLLSESQMLELASSRFDQVRLLLASRPDLTTDVIRAIVGNESELEIVSLALRCYDGTELFSELAKNPDPRIRRLAAAKEKTPDSVLLDLANDNYKMVRQALACREDLSLPIQQKLARDPSSDIRIELAKNDELLFSAYEILKDDIDPVVRETATS